MGLVTNQIDSTHLDPSNDKKSNLGSPKTSSESNTQNQHTSTKVQVAIRIRPNDDSNNEKVHKNHKQRNNILDFSQNENEIRVLGSYGQVGGVPRLFKYDHVFGPTSTQTEVYENSASALVNKFFEGYNVTILAYGQTSSGKSYTMGTKGEYGEKGVVGFALEELFNKINQDSSNTQNQIKREFKVSYIEVYNEDLIDLISEARGNLSRSPILIREDTHGRIIWSGAIEQKISSVEDAMSLLLDGSMVRQTGKTKMNTQSSRSHAIYMIAQSQTEIRNGIEMRSVSKFNFVDLAGSERLKKTQAVGDRAREGISINSGLLALGNVISALSDAQDKYSAQNGNNSSQNSFVPYRDSKLTRLLQDSLGGTAHTLMIACVSMSESDVMETLNTLKYASRANNIKNKSFSNWESVDSTLHTQIAFLRQEVARLKEELASRTSASKDTDISIKNLGDNTHSHATQQNDNIELMPSQSKQFILEEKINYMESELETANEAYTDLLLRYNELCVELEDQSVPKNKKNYKISNNPGHQEIFTDDRIFDQNDINLELNSQYRDINPNDKLNDQVSMGKKGSFANSIDEESLFSTPKNKNSRTNIKGRLNHQIGSTGSEGSRKRVLTNTTPSHLLPIITSFNDHKRLSLAPYIPKRKSSSLRRNKRNQKPKKLKSELNKKESKASSLRNKRLSSGSEGFNDSSYNNSIIDSDSGSENDKITGKGNSRGSYDLATSSDDSDYFNVENELDEGTFDSEINEMVKGYENLIRDLEKELNEKNEELKSKNIQLSAQSTKVAFAEQLNVSQNAQLVALKAQIHQLRDISHTEEARRKLLESQISIFETSVNRRSSTYSLIGGMVASKDAILNSNNFDNNSSKTTDKLVLSEIEKIKNQGELEIQNLKAEFSEKLEIQEKEHERDLISLQNKFKGEMDQLKTTYSGIENDSNLQKNSLLYQSESTETKGIQKKQSKHNIIKELRNKISTSRLDSSFNNTKSSNTENKFDSCTKCIDVQTQLEKVIKERNNMCQLVASAEQEKIKAQNDKKHAQLLLSCIQNEVIERSSALNQLQQLIANRKSPNDLNGLVSSKNVFGSNRESSRFSYDDLAIASVEKHKLRIEKISQMLPEERRLMLTRENFGYFSSKQTVLANPVSLETHFNPRNSHGLATTNISQTKSHQSFKPVLSIEAPQNYQIPPLAGTRNSAYFADVYNSNLSALGILLSNGNVTSNIDASPVISDFCGNYVHNNYLGSPNNRFSLHALLDSEIPLTSPVGTTSLTNLGNSDLNTFRFPQDNLTLVGINGNGYANNNQYNSIISSLPTSLHAISEQSRTLREKATHMRMEVVDPGPVPQYLLDLDYSVTDFNQIKSIHQELLAKVNKLLLNKSVLVSMNDQLTKTMEALEAQSMLLALSSKIPQGRNRYSTLTEGNECKNKLEYNNNNLNDKQSPTKLGFHPKKTIEEFDINDQNQLPPNEIFEEVPETNKIKVDKSIETENVGIISIKSTQDNKSPTKTVAVHKHNNRDTSSSIASINANIELLDSVSSNDGPESQAISMELYQNLVDERDKLNQEISSYQIIIEEQHARLRRQEKLIADIKSKPSLPNMSNINQRDKLVHYELSVDSLKSPRIIIKDRNINTKGSDRNGEKNLLRLESFGSNNYWNNYDQFQDLESPYGNNSMDSPLDNNFADLYSDLRRVKSSKLSVINKQPSLGAVRQTTYNLEKMSFDILNSTNLNNGKLNVNKLKEAENKEKVSSDFGSHILEHQVGKDVKTENKEINGVEPSYLLNTNINKNDISISGIDVDSEINPSNLVIENFEGYEYSKNQSIKTEQQKNSSDGGIQKQSVYIESKNENSTEEKPIPLENESDDISIPQFNSIDQDKYSGSKDVAGAGTRHTDSGGVKNKKTDQIPLVSNKDSLVDDIETGKFSVDGMDSLTTDLNSKSDIYKLVSLQAELEEARVKLEESEKRLESKLGQISGLEDELRAHKSLISALEENLSNFETHICELKTDNDRYTNELLRVGNESKLLKEQNTKLLYEISEAKNMVLSETKDRDIWKSRFKDLQEEMEEYRGRKKSKSSFFCF
ncbi:hypothetical protein BB559_003263 [Furculomyces boomerangus]|uniref:Kinesin motor domain-containing protein n=2 Tax=Harpellales TaxID=61421 RepID=A0A2T9YMB1_9FUNG|nr:hypothetical protein BB559_003263 [Furculomyces boomerangus]PVZ99771.1 hypothetical protein BB558_004186 [Smittium angustum]